MTRIESLKLELERTREDIEHNAHISRELRVRREELKFQISKAEEELKKGEKNNGN